MSLIALLDSGRYQAEVERLGPVMARHELWREADRRARRIMDRLLPMTAQASVRFEHGGQAFGLLSRERGRHRAHRIMLLEYARDQILAKMERRAQVARAIGEFECS